MLKINKCIIALVCSVVMVVTHDAASADNIVSQWVMVKALKGDFDIQFPYTQTPSLVSYKRNIFGKRIKGSLPLFDHKAQFYVCQVRKLDSVFKGASYYAQAISTCGCYRIDTINNAGLGRHVELYVASNVSKK